MEQLALAWMRLYVAQMDFLTALVALWPLPHVPTRVQRAVKEMYVSGDKRHTVISADFHRW